MIIVIDKVFYPATLETINSQNKHTYFKKEEEHDNGIVARRLTQTAGNYFNFDNQVGYDIWFHRNGMPDWHQDRDEQTFFKTGQSHFPICSIVFYPHVKDLVGGELIFKNNMRITPVSNRLVMFGPGLEHKVTPIQSGERVSMNINAWNYDVEVATDFN